MTVTVARLAVDADPRIRALYWRGEGISHDSDGFAVPPGHTLDLGTWFNAAPVAWWRALLPPTEFAAEVVGDGVLTVHTLDRRGVRRARRMTMSGWHRVTLDDDAVWCWLELRAGAGGGRLESLHWTSQAQARSPASRITAVVPTFGREQDAVRQVRRLLGTALSDVVRHVVLVDQAGTLPSASDMAELTETFGDRLVLLEQDNLGGSGGYARGMTESLSFPDDPVLLIDDDARIDAEGLRRMLILSTLARERTILGTPLFATEQPTALTALAEGVRSRDFRWGASDGLHEPVDLADSQPPAWTFARPTARTDYAGWWGALLPAGAIADLGLPAPFFLKWDDAEYGLRARRAGYVVSTVPGTGCWHPTWAAKGTISTWSAWPLHRNRLATAAAYGGGRGVLADSLAHQVKHVLSLQYDTADLWDRALGQVTEGSQWLESAWRDTRSQAEAVLAASASDGSSSGIPAPRALPDGRDAAVRGGLGLILGASRSVLGLFRPARVRTVVEVAATEFGWRAGLGADVVVLAGSDRLLRRDPPRARRALARTVRLHLRAARRWQWLVADYAAALPVSSSPDRWASVLRRTVPGTSTGRPDVHRIIGRWPGTGDQG
jgi:galactofuranosylgalactofuranosylrhamnosyl-N-acetylglucosaminyl-diphospho-decaprenol beta-1,5/1,6-galactofuranosyltransferase